MVGVAWSAAMENGAALLGKEDSMRKNLKWIVGVVLLAGVTTALAEPADTAGRNEIEQLRASLKEQQERLEQLETRFQNQNRKEEIAEILKEIDANGGAAGLPAWLQDLAISFDLRSRFEHRWNDTRYMPVGGAAGHTRHTKDRSRFRIRARITFEKKFMNGQMVTIIRIAGGDGNGPTSSNTTLDSAFSQKDLWLDQAYAVFIPEMVKQECGGTLVIISGKFANPLVRTEMTWDSDVNPEGFAAAYSHPMDTIEPFVKAAYLIVDEVTGLSTGNPFAGTKLSLHDLLIYAYQVGFILKPDKDIKWTAAATYYDETYQRRDTNSTTPGTAWEPEDGKLINVTNIVQFTGLGLPDDMPLALTLDWIRNCQESDGSPALRGAAAHRFRDQKDGYLIEGKLGRNSKKGDWCVRYRYTYIELNATGLLPGDADFGGPNRKGHEIGGAYNIDDNVLVSVEVIHSSPILGMPAVPSDSDDHDTLLNVQVIWRTK